MGKMALEEKAAIPGGLPCCRRPEGTGSGITGSGWDNRQAGKEGRMRVRREEGGERKEGRMNKRERRKEKARKEGKMDGRKKGKGGKTVVE